MAEELPGREWTKRDGFHDRSCITGREVGTSWVREWSVRSSVGGWCSVW